jgi:hypothetical protein
MAIWPIFGKFAAQKDGREFSDLPHYCESKSFWEARRLLIRSSDRRAARPNPLERKKAYGGGLCSCLFLPAAVVLVVVLVVALVVVLVVVRASWSDLTVGLNPSISQRFPQNCLSSTSFPE